MGPLPQMQCTFTNISAVNVNVEINIVMIINVGKVDMEINLFSFSSDTGPLGCQPVGGGHG